MSQNSNSHFDNIKDIASYLKTSTRRDGGDDFEDIISIKFDKFTSEIASIESLSADSIEFKKQKDNILSTLSSSKEEYGECQEQIESNTTEFDRFSNHIDLQPQSEIERNRVEELKLEQIKLQTKLQAIIANQEQIQTKLLQLSQKIQQTKDKLNSIKEYIESELNRLKKDDSVPAVVKYLICDKHIAYLENSDELKDAVLFLEMSHKLIFGALINRISDIKDELGVDKDEIKRVYEFLKQRLLLNNLSEAKKSLYTLDKNREKQKESEIKLEQDRDNLESCQKQRLKDPDEYLGFWDSLTNGIFNKDKRALFNEYNEKEDIYKKAKSELSSSESSATQLKNTIIDDEQRLIDLGYPTNSSKITEFEEFLVEKREAFIKEYPYFDNINVKYNLF